MPQSKTIKKPLIRVMKKIKMIKGGEDHGKEKVDAAKTKAASLLSSTTSLTIMDLIDKKILN